MEVPAAWRGCRKAQIDKNAHLEDEDHVDHEMHACVPSVEVVIKPQMKPMCAPDGDAARKGVDHPDLGLLS